MYKCSNCGATMSQPLDRCPSCRVLLSGVKCEACGYIGGKTEFINNNNRCPKCNTVAYIPSASHTSASTPSIPNRRLIIFFLAVIISGILNVTLYRPKVEQLTVMAWFFINPGIVGLIIFEIMYRTQKWLSLKTLIIYIVIAISISSWSLVLLNGIRVNYYEYVFSLTPFIAPFKNLFYAESYPRILYSFFETAIITSVAYWAVRTYKSKSFSEKQGTAIKTQADDQKGKWELNARGGNKFFEQKAKNLYQATEILKSVSTIPNLTYYVVETPDGALGRDINGFYTEAAMKTKDIVVESRQVDLEAVECSSLMGFGNIMQNHTAVAQITQAGQYAKVVLLMKCGNCGYESPVETQAGSFSRECYHCGVTNKCHRGAINIFLGSKMIEI